VFTFLDKKFINRFLSIALPIALVSLVNFGVKAVDTLMLGLVGEEYLSGAAQANQLSFMFMVIVGSGVAGGAAVMTAQFWGAGNKKRVREIFAFMFKVVAAVSLLFSAAAIFAPHAIMRILTSDADVIYQGVIYLRIIGVGFMFWGFSNACAGILRSVGVVKIPVFIFSGSLILSAFLNYLLIFGNFGFPEMGIAGAATATLIARIIEFFVLAVYLLKIEKNLAFRIKHLFLRREKVAKVFVKFGLPVVINETFWSSGFFVVNVIIGHIGREFVAANAVAGLVLQLTGIVIFSMCNATAVIVGNTIGEGHYKHAKSMANGMIVISFIVGLACTAIIQAIRIPFVNFYELSEDAHTYAHQLIHILSVSVIFMSVALISMLGTLRGGGDVKFVMITDIIFMWLIGIPLGVFFGLVLGFPVWVVFIILRSDDFFKTIVVLWRVPKGKWLKDLTKT